MASYDIIGGIVDPKALAELQNIEKIANNIAVKLRGVTLGSISKEADAALVQRLNAETAKLVAQEQKLQNQIQKTNQARSEKIKLTTEEKVSQTALNNVEKLSAVLASQYTTALQKLDAQIKLNIIDAQKYVQAGDTQNPMYLQNIANTKKLSQEYDRLAKASGATMQKTSSMYGATFSLTQVMRELPNFAIDARIGFMALSNNLPMLAENFSRVKHEIDAITGKEKGFIGAFKEFGKSLLSLNTIMIVLSTVMILFGDDIVKFIGNLSKGADSVDKLTLSQRALINVMKESSSAAKSQISNVIELGAKIRKYGDDSKYSKDIIDEFNKTFDTHYTSMVEIKNEYPKLANAAIQAAIKMAAADKLIQDASAQTLRNMQAKQTLSVYSKKDIDTYKKITDEMFSLMDSVGISVNRKNKIFSEFATNTWDENISYFAGVQKEMLNLSEQYNNGVVNEQTKAAKNYLAITRELRATINKSSKGMIDDQIKSGNEIISALFNEQGAKVAVSGLEKAIDELYQYKLEKEKPEGDRRDKNSDMRMLLGWMGLPLDYEKIMKKINENIKKLQTVDENELGMAIDRNLRYASKMYEKGALTFQEFETFKTMQLQIAKDNNIELTDEMWDILTQATDKGIQSLIEMESELMNDRLDRVEQFYDVSLALADSFYKMYNEKLEEQSEKEKKIEDEKYKDIEDREKAGVITKQEAEEEKARTAEYYLSVQDEINRRKEEQERRQFLLEQAAAIAKIWINYVLTASAYNAQSAAAPLLAPYFQGMKAEALYEAIAGSAVAAAQAIPYFKDGVESSPEGLAVLGDGYKHELAITPSGKYFISDNKPTMYNLEKGTQILPDINRMDLASILALKQVMPEMKDNTELLSELRNVTNAVKSQRQGNFYGMPLIKQIENRNKYSSRSRSLMN